MPGTACSQGRLDVGAVIVRVPGGNLRQALDHAVPRDIGRIGRRVPRIVRHGSHPANRHTLQVKPPEGKLARHP